jgi:CubicO group peptidase (beta-lactamase class C family)
MLSFTRIWQLALFVLAATALCNRAIAGPKDACNYSASQEGVSCLVMIDGKTIYEAYDGRGAPDKAWGLASGTKSFSGLAAAAAVQDRLISLDEKMSDTLTEWQGDGRAEITVRQMLSLSSGIETPAPMEQLRIDYREAIALSLTSKPGTSFVYGQAPFQIFAAFMERKLNGEKYESYLRRRVLDPIGVTLEMREGLFGLGDPNWGGGGVMTARDWAKFGELVRLGGKWQGKQLVDPSALGECFKGSAANPGYGITWWLKPPKGARLPASKTMETATDLYAGDAPATQLWMAAGAGKQRLYIVPERRMVAVRQTARMLMGERVPYSDLEFLRLLLAP